MSPTLVFTTLNSLIKVPSAMFIILVRRCKPSFAVPSMNPINSENFFWGTVALKSQEFFASKSWPTIMCAYWASAHALKALAVLMISGQVFSYSESTDRQSFVERFKKYSWTESGSSYKQNK